MWLDFSYLLDRVYSSRSYIITVGPFLLVEGMEGGSIRSTGPRP